MYNDAAAAFTKTNGAVAHAETTARALATKSAGTTDRALTNQTGRC